MHRLVLWLLAALNAILAACSPALDWREFQPEGSGIVAAFPCKPDRHARSVKLEVQTVRMEMLVCSVGEVSFALSFADLDDPARVPAALQELRALAVSNLASPGGETLPLQVPGMTPNPMAARIRLDGRRPDGTAMQEQAAFFVKGLRIYQATVLGKRVPIEAADTFLGSLRLPA
ncbi:hypothetical protein [uncultured Piscinibacter sp.]|uniref:hypothetical protein n=1 Tax=uncultured Piscinibacter sp. TaxID=1131835 RepID=UPI002615B86D|nr:hypothetical protein [uncultured Piscinibacter sp.]